MENKNGNVKVSAEELGKKIKNLQVSISIANREKKDILTMFPSLKAEEKRIKLTRIAQLDIIIAEKNKALQPLLAQRGTQSGRGKSKVQVSQTQIDETVKKYGLSI